MTYSDTPRNKQQKRMTCFTGVLGYWICSICKENYYDDIGTKKQFCVALEWNYSDDTVDVVLKYDQCFIIGELI